jgi:hypothetical protein
MSIYEMFSHINPELKKFLDYIIKLENRIQNLELDLVLLKAQLETEQVKRDFDIAKAKSDIVMSAARYSEETAKAYTSVLAGVINSNLRKK